MAIFPNEPKKSSLRWRQAVVAIDKICQACAIEIAGALRRAAEAQGGFKVLAEKASWPEIVVVNALAHPIPEMSFNVFSTLAYHLGFKINCLLEPLDLDLEEEEAEEAEEDSLGELVHGEEEEAPAASETGDEPEGLQPGHAGEDPTTITG